MFSNYPINEQNTTKELNKGFIKNKQLKITWEKKLNIHT